MARGARRWHTDVRRARAAHAHVEGVGVPCKGRVHQGARSVMVDGVDVAVRARGLGEQVWDQELVPSPTRPHQRRHPPLVLALHVGAVPQQRVRHVVVAVPAREDERGLAHHALGDLAEGAIGAGKLGHPVVGGVAPQRPTVRSAAPGAVPSLPGGGRASSVSRRVRRRAHRACPAHRALMRRGG